MYHHLIVIIISDFYNSYMTRKIESTNQVKLRSSDFPPVNEIGGDIDYGNKSTGV